MKKAIVFFIFLSLDLNSECNFPTGKYINELDNPKNILLIEAEVPKSSSYAKNIFKIYTSKTRNIPPKLKKKFKANIKVYYAFGECLYQASIRQHGDWKDHISLIKNGQPIRSLDVQLIDGNILNAVGFKLLLPKTRNGLNEVLGSLILKDLGFIVPETFEVATIVNGISSVMLFQEKSAKELLERNHKREGPIFEGDESLLWSFKDFTPFELEPLATSRLVNNNWFEKGENSQAIVLHSYAILQNSYLNYAHINYKTNDQYEFFPNLTIDDKTINYHAALIAMNGWHAIRPHNRKFYFNALEIQFEPIYYDGDLDLKTPLKNWDQHIGLKRSKSSLPRMPSKKFLKLSESLGSDGVLKENFLNRTTNQNQAQVFYETSIKQFKENMKFFEKDQQLKMSYKNFDKDYFQPKYEWYESFMKSKEIKQGIITAIDFNDNNYNLIFKNIESIKSTPKNISKFLKSNNLGKSRAVYIPSIDINTINSDYKIMNIGSGVIKMSKGINIEITEDQKIIKFIQSNPMDWVLLSNWDMNSWIVSFNGAKYIQETEEVTKQRFNDHGLTGCLTIYNSDLSQSSFTVNNGGCEDSINIINSFGRNINLVIENAKADAIDADFSDLEFENLQIKNALNDCFDVSGGKYKINEGYLENCQDKAISVGEKSILTANKIIINDANIGIAAKDLSKVKISQMDAKNINVCADVNRKKQEFGGAKLTINDLKCSAKINVDAESIFLNSES